MDSLLNIQQLQFRWLHAIIDLLIGGLDRVKKFSVASNRLRPNAPPRRTTKPSKSSNIKLSNPPEICNGLQRESNEQHMVAVKVTKLSLRH